MCSEEYCKAAALPLSIRASIATFGNFGFRDLVNIWIRGDTMHHRLITLGAIAAATTVMGQASAQGLNSAELKTLFSDTTVKFTNQKGLKVTLWLRSDGSSSVHVVLAKDDKWRSMGDGGSRNRIFTASSSSRRRNPFVGGLVVLKRGGRITQLT